MTQSLPAWSEPFATDQRAGLRRLAPFEAIDRAWAFGDGSGAGVVVAVVDSGVEGAHPAVGGALRESVRVELQRDDAMVVAAEPVDEVGPSTARARIVHGLSQPPTIQSVH